MYNGTSQKEKHNRTNEFKQNFLSSAISDVSTYIVLIDTKVSIIMAAVVAGMVGGVSCHELINNATSLIKPCSWLGISLIIFVFILIVSIIGVFTFGILTIQGHSSKVAYKSKWFITQSTSEYSFDSFKRDVLNMTDDDVIENMSAELYKLNDINRQKSQTYKQSLRCFSVSLISTFLICTIFVFVNL